MAAAYRHFSREGKDQGIQGSRYRPFPEDQGIQGSLAENFPGIQGIQGMDLYIPEGFRGVRGESAGDEDQTLRRNDP